MTFASDFLRLSLARLPSAADVSAVAYVERTNARTILIRAINKLMLQLKPAAERRKNERRVFVCARVDAHPPLRTISDAVIRTDSTASLRRARVSGILTRTRFSRGAAGREEAEPPSSAPRTLTHAHRGGEPRGPVDSRCLPQTCLPRARASAAVCAVVLVSRDVLYHLSDWI